ncbi:MAG: hypothetical protein M5U29_11825 [Anaerolineae bacterium]|nr:hypothetical protein [Anaerolineae bacterium]
MLIDTRKHELRSVGLGAEMLAGSPLAALPEDQRASLRVPVFDLTYQATDQSVRDRESGRRGEHRQARPVRQVYPDRPGSGWRADRAAWPVLGAAG